MKNPAIMTEEEIKSLPRRDVSIKQFIAICSKLDDPTAVNVTEDFLEMLENGTFLAIHSADGGKTYKRLHLKKVWIRKFNMNYSIVRDKNGKGLKGGELLISNSPLPRGKIVSL